MIASPQQNSKSLETSIVQAAGRDASGGVIAAAVQSALEEKWTVSGLLGKVGLAHTPQTLIGPLGSWALCKAEVDTAEEEKRSAHAYVEFLDKAMIASATTEAVETCSGFASGRAEARRCKDGKAIEQQEDEE